MAHIVVISDLQIPYHDRKAVDAVIEYIAHAAPSKVVNVGDELDAPQPSRWNKALAGEYAGDLQKHIEENYYLQETILEASGFNYEIMRSNHVDRIETYVKRYAPALGSLAALKTEQLLGYDELGITYHRTIADLAPGWVLAHGDEGGMSQVAGSTALSLAKRVGKSVACGHTHRAGFQHHNEGYSGRLHRQLYGLEVGHLMDIKKAHYLKSGAANWQQAIGELYVDGREVTPVLRLIKNGKLGGPVS